MNRCREMVESGLRLQAVHLRWGKNPACDCFSMATRMLAALWLFGLTLPIQAECFQIRIPTTSPLNAVAVMEGYRPESTLAVKDKIRVLLLVPGYNAKGKDSYFAPEAGWLEFADREKVILLTSNFQTSPTELHEKRGYYYASQWSGAAIENALLQLAERYPVDTQQIALFGFSAGAHFVHRFAQWMPERVLAFAAYSAGWWDSPDSNLNAVPALIMCGQEDIRYEATFRYFQQGSRLELPWIWRSYRNTGHEVTPAVTRMAQAFLSHYLQNKAMEPQVGDLQTYKVYPMENLEEIPTSCRVILPTPAVASVWNEE